jgi:hypothetical protein
MAFLPTHVTYHFLLTVYVLYNRNRFIVAAILIALTAEISIMAVGLGITLPRLRFGETCLISGTPGIFMAFW